MPKEPQEHTNSLLIAGIAPVLVYNMLGITTFPQDKLSLMLENIRTQALKIAELNLDTLETIVSDVIEQECKDTK
jgi:hypothetical protein